MRAPTAAADGALPAAAANLQAGPAHAAAATDTPPQPVDLQADVGAAAAEAGQCPVCLEELAGLTLHVYPCGHTFCEPCSKKVWPKPCSICRYSRWLLVPRLMSEAWWA